ncbi:4'-phosphopantetheinyl transferase family protein [Herbaspirillum sp. alder98]|uniref:4'-phosphopantetheinyl transferase family protein n=1 Tax=Herbaspirillum sp. alder98 TaxID=2913096 RepID=UPI001CD8605A|nr:4'-phosphopantetheinyl transferase superfamily protein [Herbaspirillum sp. alder98]MCA1323718.1 4'-phosphopantetheinyl transferase superfamily protein [Herbaspirillum sp. alder98]
MTTPESVPPQIALWQVDFDFARSAATLDWSCLSADELAHAARYRQWPDRVRYGAMRVALRQLLASRMDCRPETLRFAINAFGKPRLATPGGPAFNQSHAARAGLVALADGLDVGVDIECDELSIAPDELDGMTQLMLGPRERERAGRLDMDGFLRRWVGKEAALKALGVGIAEHLHTLEVCPHDDGRYTVSHGRPDWPQVHARRLEHLPGYAAALAWSQP